MREGYNSQKSPLVILILVKSLIVTDVRIYSKEMLLTRMTVISGKARQMLRLNVADNIGPVDRFKPAVLLCAVIPGRGGSLEYIQRYVLFPL